MIVPIAKLEAGMELAADVLNLNGLLLLGKGAVLSERHLRIFKTWGVEGVNVVGDTPAADGPDLEATFSREALDAAEAAIARRLRLVLTASPVVDIIRGLAVRRQARLEMQLNRNSSRD